MSTWQNGSVIDGDTDNCVQASKVHFPPDPAWCWTSSIGVEECRTLIQFRVVIISIHCLVRCSISDVYNAVAEMCCCRCVLPSRHVFHSCQKLQMYIAHLGVDSPKRRKFSPHKKIRPGLMVDLFNVYAYKIFNKLRLIIARKFRTLYLHNTSEKVQKLAIYAAKSFQLLRASPDLWPEAQSAPGSHLGHSCQTHSIFPHAMPAISFSKPRVSG